jgi:xylulokinase
MRRGRGEIGLIGGGAKSLTWARMIAAATDRPILRYQGGETGPALGAARLARLAKLREAPEAVCKPPPVMDRIEPDPALVSQFKARLERFRSLYRALAPEFRGGA